MTQKDSIELDELPVADDKIRRDQYDRYLVVPPTGGKPTGYTRVTTVAKALDDNGGLAPWKAAMAVSGVLTRRGLRARFESLLAEHGSLWYSGKDVKREAKQLIEEAAAAGGADDRREVGTALHAITTLVDTGRMPKHMSDEMSRDIATYVQTLQAHGIKMVNGMAEVVTVIDSLQVAGTFDRVVTVPGFELPLIADLKTGNDLQYSWLSIAVQMALYSRGEAIYRQGEAADGSLDVRTPMPAVDQHWGLIMWLNADVEGEATLELFYVDLDAGWEAVQHSMWAREWRKAKPSRPFNEPLPTRDEDVEAALEASLAEVLGGVFGMPDERTTGATSVGSTIDEVFGARGSAEVDSRVIGGYQDVEVRRHALQWRIDWIGQHPLARRMLSEEWPEGLPTLRASALHSAQELDAIEQVLVYVERENFLPDMPTEQDAIARVVDLFEGAHIISPTTTP